MKMIVRDTGKVFREEMAKALGLLRQDAEVNKQLGSRPTKHYGRVAGASLW
jgi:hypothetical protein